MSMFRSLLGIKEESGGLPSTFQQVEYVENTSEGYVHTGYIYETNTKIEIDFYADSSNNDYPFLLGSKGTGNHNLGFLVNHAYLGGAFVYQYGGGEAYSRTTIYDEKVHLVINGVQATYSDEYGASVTLTANGSANRGQAGMLLFNTNSATSSGSVVISEQYMIGRIYECKIYEGNTLIRHFIPCYQKSDSAIGFYDIITNEFYEGSNQSDLIVGSDV